MVLASTSTPTTQVIVAWPSATAVDPELLAVDVSVEVADVGAAYEWPRSQALRLFVSCATSRGAFGGSLSETRQAARSTLPAIFKAQHPDGVSLVDPRPGRDRCATTWESYRVHQV